MANLVPAVADLPRLWREHADQFRRCGCTEAAATHDALADQLDQALREHTEAPLTLDQASRASGYSRDHLARLIRRGTLPNAGRRRSPRIRQGDLPQKPGADRLAPVSEVDARTTLAPAVVRDALRAKLPPERRPA